MRSLLPEAEALHSGLYFRGDTSLLKAYKSKKIMKQKPMTAKIIFNRKNLAD